MTVQRARKIANDLALDSGGWRRISDPTSDQEEIITAFQALNGRIWLRERKLEK